MQSPTAVRSEYPPAGLSPTSGGSTSAVSWPAIFAGAFVAAATTLFLMALGTGLGFAVSDPWPRHAPAATTFATTTAIWLIVTQWLSAALGGYIAGRLRTRWIGTHTHEVFFRDTAHGFVTWAVATVLVALLFGIAALATLGAGAPAIAPGGEADLTDAARKAAAHAAIYTSLGMVVGAFIASVSAALGGYLRDQHV